MIMPEQCHLFPKRMFRLTHRIKPPFLQSSCPSKVLLLLGVSYNWKRLLTCPISRRVCINSSIVITTVVGSDANAWSIADDERPKPTLRKRWAAFAASYGSSCVGLHGVKSASLPAESHGGGSVTGMPSERPTGVFLMFFCETVGISIDCLLIRH